MNKKELRNKMENYVTICGARKELLNDYNRQDEVSVRCYSTADDGMITTDLQIEVENSEWTTITICRIEVEEVEGAEYFWNFVELSREVLKTMKKNVVKELLKYNVNYVEREDYVS